MDKLNTNWDYYINDCCDKLTTKRTRLVKINNNPRYLITATHKLLNFISNDYLGLSTNPQLKSAMRAAINSYGAGSTGSANLSGYTKEHELLQTSLAKWLGFEACLLFNSGYQLNVSIFSKLTDLNTHIWLDKNCHASIIDGVLLSRAKFTTFSSNNIDNIIATILTKTQQRHIIISEGTFSMDGLCHYWHKLIELKKSNYKNILLVIDDAHGVGAIGHQGFGSLECQNIDLSYIDLFIGTLGKAFASHGAFICGKSNIIYYLTQTVRSQIFSTNLPPSITAASNAALAIINSDAGKLLRHKLMSNIKYFGQLATKHHLNIVQNNNSPIQLLIFNNEEKVIRIYEQLLKQNIIVGKIFYPTVAKHAPRIRISLSTKHTKNDIKQLVHYMQNMI